MEAVCEPPKGALRIVVVDHYAGVFWAARFGQPTLAAQVWREAPRSAAEALDMPARRRGGGCCVPSIGKVHRVNHRTEAMSPTSFRRVDLTVAQPALGDSNTWIPAGRLRPNACSVAAN